MPRKLSHRHSKFESHGTPIILPINQKDFGNNFFEEKLCRCVECVRIDIPNVALHLLHGGMEDGLTECY